MAGLHVKREDTVVVISGAEKGKRGRVLSVDPQKERVVVEGINTRRTTLRRSPQNPRGGLTERECPIHISNVMSAEEYDNRREKKNPQSGQPQQQTAAASTQSENPETTAAETEESS